MIYKLCAALSTLSLMVITGVYVMSTIDKHTADITTLATDRGIIIQAKANGLVNVCTLSASGPRRCTGFTKPTTGR